MKQRKIEILNQIAENMELMKSIERVVELADHNPFVESIQAEWHKLREENERLMEKYEEVIKQ